MAGLTDTITVYGASDDLVEVEGAITEEFAASTDGDLLAFSDGTVLRITYTQAGVWRIVPVHVHAAATVLTIDPAPEDDDTHYTDRAYLSGTFAWVVRGDRIATRR